MAYEIRPRTDYHSLNADWILEEMHKAVDAWKTSETYWTSAKQAFDEMKESFQTTTDQLMAEWPIFKKNVEDAQIAFQNEMLGHYAEFTSDTLEEYDKFKTAQQNAYNSFVSTINEQWDSYKETMNAAFHDLTVTEAEARVKLEEDVHTYVQDWFKNLDVAETVKEETIAYLGSEDGKAFLTAVINEEVISPINAKIAALETWKEESQPKLEEIENSKANLKKLLLLAWEETNTENQYEKFFKELPFIPTEIVHISDPSNRSYLSEPIYGICVNTNTTVWDSYGVYNVNLTENQRMGAFLMNLLPLDLNVLTLKPFSKQNTVYIGNYDNVLKIGGQFATVSYISYGSNKFAALGSGYYTFISFSFSAISATENMACELVCPFATLPHPGAFYFNISGTTNFNLISSSPSGGFLRLGFVNANMNVSAINIVNYQRFGV